MTNYARTWHARTWPLALMLSASAMLTSNLAMAQGSVGLAFAWPDDVKASVSFEAERAHSSGNKEVKRGLKGSYNMSTSPAPEGLKVSFSDFSVEPSKTEDPKQAKLQNFLASVGTYLPDFVVTPEGNLVRLEGVTELRRNAINAFDEISKNLTDEVKSRLDRTLNALISDQRLKGSVQTQWKRDVAAWSGKTFEPGKLQTTQRTQPVSMLKNAELPLTTSIGITKLMACKEGMADDSCALVTVTSRLATTELTPELSATLKGSISGAPEALEVQAVEILSSLELLTEPKTLLPHSVSTFRRLKVTHSLEGKQSEIAQVESRRTSYDYQ